MKKEKSLRETIRFYLIDCKTPLGKVIDAFILLLNLIICGMFVLDTHNITKGVRSTLWKIELVIVGIFIIEYGLRLYGARKRIKHIFDIFSMIDLLAILPTVLIVLVLAFSYNLGFIRILRVLKVFRVLRFLRFTTDPYFFFGNITDSLLKVVRLIIIILMIFFVSSGFFWLSESGINPEVNNFGDAFYFTVIALTTIGFGDIIPMSEGGWAVTVLMIISGIILIPWQASQIVREWVHLSSKKNNLSKMWIEIP